MAEPIVKRLSHFSFYFFFGAVYNFYWKSKTRSINQPASYRVTLQSMQQDEAPAALRRWWSCKYNAGLRRQPVGCDTACCCTPPILPPLPVSISQEVLQTLWPTPSGWAARCASCNHKAALPAWLCRGWKHTQTFPKVTALKYRACVHSICSREQERSPFLFHRTLSCLMWGHMQITAQGCVCHIINISSHPGACFCRHRINIPIRRRRAGEIRTRSSWIALCWPSRIASLVLQANQWARTLLIHFPKSFWFRFLLLLMI